MEHRPRPECLVLPGLVSAAAAAVSIYVVYRLSSSAVVCLRLEAASPN